MTHRKVGGEVTFSSNRKACPPSVNTRTRKVHEYTWGQCAICRQKAHAAGVQDIMEGSQWCAQFCTREGPWACQEPATTEMVAAWRAWALEKFAAMDRDALWAERGGVQWPTMGDPWARELRGGRAVRGKVVG